MQENLATTQYSSVPNISLEYYSFLAPTGYTQAAIDNIKSLEKNGVDVFLRCIHSRMVATGMLDSQKLWLEKLLAKKKDYYSCTFLHAIPPRWPKGKDFKNKIALFVFENKNIPKEWTSSLRSCSAVIVPSDFNYKSCIDNGINNVFKVNHSIDFNIWNQDLPKLIEYEDIKKIKIITIGTWRERKNWKNMFLAIVDIINNGVDVLWTIKTDKSGAANLDMKKWLNETGYSQSILDKIKVDSRVIDETSIARLVKSHDLLLSASRGEGFCLPALQAAAIGVPVVCPNYGGYCEFFDKNIYTEILPSGLEKLAKMDNLPQFSNLEWPIYDKDSVLDALYLCIGKLHNGSFDIPLAVKKINNNFNHFKIGKDFVDIIRKTNVITSNKN
jgi:glycosyltransferase involved in cell wall biosynthesis